MKLMSFATFVFFPRGKPGCDESDRKSSVGDCGDSDEEIDVIASPSGPNDSDSLGCISNSIGGRDGSCDDTAFTSTGNRSNEDFEIQLAANNKSENNNGKTSNSGFIVLKTDRENDNGGGTELGDSASGETDSGIGSVNERPGSGSQSLQHEPAGLDQSREDQTKISAVGEKKDEEATPEQVQDCDPREELSVVSEQPQSQQHLDDLAEDLNRQPQTIKTSEQNLSRQELHRKGVADRLSPVTIEQSNFLTLTFANFLI